MQDLPVLKSVTSTIGPSGMSYLLVALLAFSVSAVALFLFMPLYEHRHISQLEYLIIFTFGAVSISIFAMMRRSSWFDGYWKTDLYGITIRGLLRTIIVPWSEIVDARTEWLDIAVGYSFCLRTEKLHLNIPTWDNYLSASIWQNLRRFGMSDRLRLSEEASAFWQPLPDNIPNEYYWEDNKLSFLHGRHAARSFKLTEKGFEAETLMGQVTMDWDDVVYARWHGRSLVIKSNSAGIHIPWIDGDNNSTLLALAIIHRLRQLDAPVQVPVLKYMVPEELRDDTPA